MHDNDPQIFLLTETQLKSNIGIQVDGYQFYGRKREGRNGGETEQQPDINGQERRYCTGMVKHLKK